MPDSKNQPVKKTDDRRWKLVNRTMRLHGGRPDALIETLHSVQESFGYLDLDALRYVAESLHLPLSRVYGVATFYHFFTFKPPGKHTCVVCTGTACYIAGSSAILKEVKGEFGLTEGQTTPDNKISLLTARCMGSCGLAPAAVLDGEVKGKVTPPSLLDQMRRWRDADD